MSADALREPMVDRAHLKVDGLHRAKRPLDVAERFVASHRLGAAHLLLHETGPYDIDPVECGLGGDHLIAQRKLEAVIFDGELEVLGDLVLVDHAADPDTDPPCAVQVTAIHHGADLFEVLRRRLE